MQSLYGHVLVNPPPPGILRHRLMMYCTCAFSNPIQNFHLLSPLKQHTYVWVYFHLAFTTCEHKQHVHMPNFPYLSQASTFSLFFLLDHFFLWQMIVAIHKHISSSIKGTKSILSCFLPSFIYPTRSSCSTRLKTFFYFSLLSFTVSRPSEAFP